MVPGTITKVRICNICEIFSIQDQGYQLASQCFDDMHYIIIKNLCNIIQVEFF
jgi:hypothetical protein